ncbi:MAG: hypothetical protein Sylvanvirus2_35 [Sylvanvirus sp.]|uniref:Uracil-DNA glycosylase-like domain-containing protein n=1 Tax=Sylvanvirus sp. TaxID=2487774 RepID=A0A3G5AKS2_9VIRU|nr:MAG: hypothetical protein Sylvanvirus2_35 [Sylvanvirus sp.]
MTFYTQLKRDVTTYEPPFPILDSSVTIVSFWYHRFCPECGSYLKDGNKSHLDVPWWRHVETCVVQTNSNKIFSRMIQQATQWYKQSKSDLDVDTSKQRMISCLSYIYEGPIKRRFVVLDQSQVTGWYNRAVDLFIFSCVFKTKSETSETTLNQSNPATQNKNKNNKNSKNPKTSKNYKTSTNKRSSNLTSSTQSVKRWKSEESENSENSKDYESESESESESELTKLNRIKSQSHSSSQPSGLNYGMNDFSMNNFSRMGRVPGGILHTLLKSRVELREQGMEWLSRHNEVELEQSEMRECSLYIGEVSLYMLRNGLEPHSHVFLRVCDQTCCALSGQSNKCNKSKLPNRLSIGIPNAHTLHTNHHTNDHANQCCCCILDAGDLFCISTLEHPRFGDPRSLYMLQGATREVVQMGSYSIATHPVPFRSLLPLLGTTSSCNDFIDMLVEVFDVQQLRDVWHSIRPSKYKSLVTPNTKRNAKPNLQSILIPIPDPESKSNSKLRKIGLRVHSTEDERKLDDEKTKTNINELTESLEHSLEDSLVKVKNLNVKSLKAVKDKKAMEPLLTQKRDVLDDSDGDSAKSFNHLLKQDVLLNKSVSKDSLLKELDALDATYVKGWDPAGNIKQIHQFFLQRFGSFQPTDSIDLSDLSDSSDSSDSSDLTQVDSTSCSILSLSHDSTHAPKPKPALSTQKVSQVSQINRVVDHEDFEDFEQEYRRLQMLLTRIKQQMKELHLDEVSTSRGNTCSYELIRMSYILEHGYGLVKSLSFLSLADPNHMLPEKADIAMVPLQPYTRLLFIGINPSTSDEEERRRGMAYFGSKNRFWKLAHEMFIDKKKHPLRFLGPSSSCKSVPTLSTDKTLIWLDKQRFALRNLVSHTISKTSSKLRTENDWIPGAKALLAALEHAPPCFIVFNGKIAFDKFCRHGMDYIYPPGHPPSCIYGLQVPYDPLYRPYFEFRRGIKTYFSVFYSSSSSVTNPDQVLARQKQWRNLAETWQTL